MDRWFNIRAGTQGSKGVASSRDRVICRGSVNRPWAGVQLVGKCGVEEEVMNNIPRKEGKL